MANEIKFNFNFECINGLFQSSFFRNNIYLTQSAVGEQSGVVNIGTSEEDLSTGDLASSDQGLLIIQNLDTTNYVSYGPKNGGSMILLGRINPKEVVFMRLAPSVILRMIANSSAVNIQYLLLKN